MKLSRIGTPLFLLEELEKAPGGRIERRAMLQRGDLIAGSAHNAVVALNRLQAAGLVRLEYRLTRAGYATLHHAKK